MLSFLGRRKILYVTRVRAINKTVINPSRDAKSCVSQAIIPQTYALQYTAYKYVFIPRETQNLASHKQPFSKPTRCNIPHINMFLFLGRRNILHCCPNNFVK